MNEFPEIEELEALEQQEDTDLPEIWLDDDSLESMVSNNIEETMNSIHDSLRVLPNK